MPRWYAVKFSLNRTTPIFPGVTHRRIKRQRAALQREVISPVNHALMLGDALKGVTLDLPDIGIEVEGETRCRGHARSVWVQRILEQGVGQRGVIPLRDEVTL